MRRFIHLAASLFLLFCLPVYSQAIKWKNYIKTTGSTYVNSYSCTAPFGYPTVLDFNNDGYADLLWQQVGDTQRVVWYQQNGSIPGAAPLNGTGEALEGAGDFNGDGKCDLLVSTPWDGGRQLHLCLTDVEGTAGFCYGGSLPLGASVLGVGDCTGDGKAEVIWRNGPTICFRTVGATAQPVDTTIGGAGMEWAVVGCADFDGNRLMDVLFRHSTNGTLAIWLVGPNGYAGAIGGLGAVSLDWHIFGLGDVDGDRRADVLWRHNSTGAMSVWYITESGIKGAGALPGCGDLDWKTVGVADHNGDGRSDVLWRYQPTGAYAIWFLNEAGYAGAVGLPVVAPKAWLTQNNIIFAGEK